MLLHHTLSRNCKTNSLFMPGATPPPYHNPHLHAMRCTGEAVGRESERENSVGSALHWLRQFGVRSETHYRTMNHELRSVGCIGPAIRANHQRSPLLMLLTARCLSVCVGFFPYPVSWLLYRIPCTVDQTLFVKTLHLCLLIDHI